MIFVCRSCSIRSWASGVIQFSAALEQKPQVVVVVGAEYLPDEPPLLEPGGRRLRSRAVRSAGRSRAGSWSQLEPAHGPWARARERREQAIRGGRPSAVLIIPRRPAARSFDATSRDRDPDPLQQRRRAEPDHLFPAQGDARSLEARRSSTAGSRRDKMPPELRRADPGEGRGRGDRAARCGGSVWAGCFRSCW